MNLALFNQDIPRLFPYLETIIQDGGKRTYGISGEISIFCFVDGTSGFNYHEEAVRGSIGFGVLFGGLGFVLRRHLLVDGLDVERFDYFNQQGEFTFTSQEKNLETVIVDSLEMDLSCPILNHFYNYLSVEYRSAAEGKFSTTAQVVVIERFLKDLYRSRAIHLPIEDGVKDSCITNIYQKILKAEKDPVLTWEERHLVFANYKETLDKILSVKIRAHKLSKAVVHLGLLRRNFSNFMRRFKTRPLSNSRGLLYRYTVGKIIWFFQTVKNNLGYSVALAVYGPFTYYFITMPMNPHAMQAVGKVRSVYLDTKTEISDLWDRNLTVAPLKPVLVPVLSGPVTQDQVSVIHAAPIQESAPKGVDPMILANVITDSFSMGPIEESVVDMGEGVKEKFKPTFLNMLVSTDVGPVNKQSWIDRMSRFKQMEIGYEENIEYASRMGRLEQLETQYNFPMQIESTWEELERYNNMIFRLREENPNLSPKMKQFLTNEVNRTQQIELYLWDRMGRFILDQIYVMLDQDNEQKRSDYYVGRSFVFMQEMTNILSWRYKDLKKPEGYERIEKLANFYTGARKEFGSVTKNLKENSDLFKQKDLLDTREFRAYMKRQWEILYLQNSKAEEAANNGLNMYIWSVRNTAWVLQSIYSAKKEELGLLVKRDVSGQPFNNSDLLARNKISLLYETLVHNLTLEYVGIREEIMNRLGKDIESTQRMVVLENLKEFLTDREKLDGLNVVTSKTTAESNP